MVEKKLIVHILFKLDTGGLERVLVDTVNGLGKEYRHAVISLTSASHKLVQELPSDVEIFVLDKRDGHDYRVWWSVTRLLFRMSPQIVHTYNFACLEFQAFAWLCRVPGRVHAEHGRSAADPSGQNAKHRFLRRTMRLFVKFWVPVSADLEGWLLRYVGIDPSNVVLIRNGVDTGKFLGAEVRSSIHEQKPIEGFCVKESFVVGTIGRLDPVKNHAILLDVWEVLLREHPDQSRGMILAIVGGGPLMDELSNQIATRGLATSVWMLGERHDIAEVLSQFDVFVLPSIAEGIPITVLEAMASGLPIVASQVGGLQEVVDENCGTLVPAKSVAALVDAILAYRNDDVRVPAGMAARARVVNHFERKNMLHSYSALYARMAGTQIVKSSQARN